MPSTTVYGYLNPITGDLSKGANGWMHSLNFDWDRIDGHTHNGIDSAFLTPAAVVPATVTAVSGGWGANTGGSGLPSAGYVQTVTTPPAVGEINNFSVTFRQSSSGVKQYQPLELFYTRVTGTSFYLYSNDNSIDVLCVFR